MLVGNICTVVQPSGLIRFYKKIELQKEKLINHNINNKEEIDTDTKDGDLKTTLLQPRNR